MILVAEFVNESEGLKSVVEQVSAIAFKVRFIDTDAGMELEPRLMMDRVNGACNALADAACNVARSFVTGEVA